MIVRSRRAKCLNYLFRRCVATTLFGIMRPEWSYRMGSIK